MRVRPGVKSANDAATGNLSGVLVAGLKDARDGRSIKRSALRRLVEMGLIEIGMFRSSLTDEGKKALKRANSRRALAQHAPQPREEEA